MSPVYISNLTLLYKVDIDHLFYLITKNKTLEKYENAEHQENHGTSSSPSFSRPILGKTGLAGSHSAFLLHLLHNRTCGR